jgi:hypothetical protein
MSGEETMANTAVFGVYSTIDAAESAVRSLRDRGFRPTDISILIPQNPGTKDLAHVRATKAPEGAAAGAGTGAAVGATLGWLAGIGALAIPGLGPLVAAGPIVAALAGAGAAGAVGGVTGALVGMGMPEYEAKRYEGRIRHGSVLMSVHADDGAWARKARAILIDTGAEDVSSESEIKGDYANSDRPHARV